MPWIEVRGELPDELAAVRLKFDRRYYLDICPTFDARQIIKEWPFVQAQFWRPPEGGPPTILRIMRSELPPYKLKRKGSKYYISVRTQDVGTPAGCETWTGVSMKKSVVEGEICFEITLPSSLTWTDLRPMSRGVRVANR